MAKHAPIRSMTGYAQLKAQAGEQVSFTLSLKAVNHRYLDLNLRFPSDADALEMKIRRALKEKIARGHVDVYLSVERRSSDLFAVDTGLVTSYVKAFRQAAAEAGIAAEPDLNAILKFPGALNTATATLNGEFDEAVLARLDEVVGRLNEMREEEGRGIERELRDRMGRLSRAVEEVSKLRTAVSRAYLEKVQARMNELIGGNADPDRILQEAAMLAERSDVQEEIARMQTHIEHFVGMLDAGGEIGKKLDFLLQEMNREANTLLSKTAGVAGEGVRITELGLELKSEIEKLREQVQNIE